MRYFVTGATGFIGGHLAARLRRDGHEVVALVRTPARAAPLTRLGVEIAEGDITDRVSLQAPMRGVDGIFHVAAWYKVGAPDASMAERINVEGTRNVLETMAALAIPRGVYTSTLAVFSDTKGRVVDEAYRFQGEHISEYDRTKWLAHYQVAEPLAQAGLPLVTVMPGLVYGPGDTSGLGDSFRDYLRGKLPMLSKKTAYCWAHVADIVEGHVLAMEQGRPGEDYIIAGPPHTLIEAFDMAEAITGIPAPRLHLPPLALRAMSAVMGVAGQVVKLPPTLSSEGLRVLAGATYLGDNSKARRQWGYDPRPLRQGLPDYLQWLAESMPATDD